MEKLAGFLTKTQDLINSQITASLNRFVKQVTQMADQKKKQETQPSISLEQAKLNEQKQRNSAEQHIDISLSRPLQNLQLQESKVIASNPKIPQADNQNSQKKSRVKQIQEQKRRILEQLKRLDSQIAQIKHQKDNDSMKESHFVKKIKISDNIEAKKQAQGLVKQLYEERKKLEEKKKKNQEKALKMQQQEDQRRLKQRQQFQKKQKEQKRRIIAMRMQEEKRKRLQRQMIQKRSNQLIAKIKKQQQIEKQKELLPNQIQQTEQKKQIFQKRNNTFNINEIQQHQKKYANYKSKQKEVRKQRSASIKVTHSMPKYAKNIWIQRIEEEEQRKKQQEKLKQLNRKKQLEKRMKYGDLVKNIFMSKHKKRQESSEGHQNHQEEAQEVIKKPQTPNIRSNLPRIPKHQQKRQNQTDKKFKERPLEQIARQNSKINIQKGKFDSLKKSQLRRKMKENKEKDPEEEQKIFKQKMRQLQLRKQTKQRLKKLQNRSVDIPKPEKVKYQNYMQQIKIKKKAPEEQWKQIMDNGSMSKEQKYQQMLHKAVSMENQAKIRQDLRKNGDQDAVNLYIGSIQAKLALLEKF